MYRTTRRYGPRYEVINSHDLIAFRRNLSSDLSLDWLSISPAPPIPGLRANSST